jgi:hypothetical protein
MVARTALAAAAAAALLATAVGSEEGARSDRRPGPAPVSVQRPEDCPVTIPNGRTAPGRRASPDQHGNGALWTALKQSGTFLVARRSSPDYLAPDGGLAVDGVLAPDGAVGIKAPWWRGPGIRGRLRLRARRLDAPAPRVDRVIPPSGYGLTGFQAMGLSLPSVGCWKVVGSVGEESLTVVTLVRRARPERP